MRRTEITLFFIVLIGLLLSNVQGQLSLQERYAQAHREFNARNFENSAKLLEAIMKDAPNAMRTYLVYGTVLEAMGRFNDAKKNYQVAMTKFPKEVEPTRVMCRLNFHELQKDKKNDLHKVQAEFFCEEVVKKWKGEAQDYLALGGVYSYTEKFEESVIALRKAYSKAQKVWEIFPHKEELLKIKSSAEYKVGNCELAVKAARELLKIDSNSICNFAFYLSSCECTIDAVQSMYDCFPCKEQTGECKIESQDPRVCGQTQMKFCGPRWDLCTSSNVQRVTIVPDADDTLVYGRKEGPLTLFPVQPPTPMNYNEKRTFIVHLKDVYMRTEGGVIHTDCYIFTGSYSFGTKLPDSFPKDLSTIFIEEPIMSIISQTNNNYYHFVTGSLSRLFLGLKYIPNSNKIKILVPGNNRFILEIVTLLKLEDRLIIYSMDQKERYFFKDLYFADWAQLNTETHQYNAWTVYQPPQLGLKLVREGILPYINKIKPIKPQMIYVGRSDILSSRHVNGEDELLAEIRTNFPSFEVISYSGSKHGIVEQAGTFHWASVVIGPHGAGLTNIMFCQEKTPIIYFPMKPNINFNYEFIAASLNLNFWSVNTVTSSFHGQYHLNSSLISDVIKTMKEALSVEKKEKENNENKSEL